MPAPADALGQSNGSDHTSQVRNTWKCFWTRTYLGDDRDFREYDVPYKCGVRLVGSVDKRPFALFSNGSKVLSRSIFGINNNSFLETRLP